MHSNMSLLKQSAQHSWPVSVRSLAGVRAISGVLAPGFGALLHLRAVVEQTSCSTRQKHWAQVCSGQPAHRVHRTKFVGMSNVGSGATVAECQAGQLTSG